MLHVRISTVLECQNIRDPIRSAIWCCIAATIFYIPYYFFYFVYFLFFLMFYFISELGAAACQTAKFSERLLISPSHLARGEADPLDEIFQLIVKALQFRTACAAPISSTTGQRAAVDWAGLNQDQHQRLFLFSVYSFILALSSSR